MITERAFGAKFIELDIGEEGSGQGGYARELSEEGKRKQQLALTERLKKADIIISTANIPGRKAPVLITEDMVRAMAPASRSGVHAARTDVEPPVA